MTSRGPFQTQTFCDNLSKIPSKKTLMNLTAVIFFLICLFPALLHQSPDLWVIVGSYEADSYLYWMFLFAPRSLICKKYVIGLKLSVQQYVKKKNILKNITVFSNPQMLIWECKCNLHLGFKKSTQCELMQHGTAALITLTIQKE